GVGVEGRRALRGVEDPESSRGAGTGVDQTATAAEAFGHGIDGAGDRVELCRNGLGDTGVLPVDQARQVDGAHPVDVGEAAVDGLRRRGWGRRHRVSFPCRRGTSSRWEVLIAAAASSARRWKTRVKSASTTKSCPVRELIAAERSAPSRAATPTSTWSAEVMLLRGRTVIATAGTPLRWAATSGSTTSVVSPEAETTTSRSSGR